MYTPITRLILHSSCTQLPLGWEQAAAFEFLGQTNGQTTKKEMKKKEMKRKERKERREKREKREREKNTGARPAPEFKQLRTRGRSF